MLDAFSRILVTGGTGSFGTSFIKKVLEDETVQLVTVFSRDWHKQEKVRKEINDDRLQFEIGDVRDYERVKEIMDRDFYDVVVHAAAIKCISACENNVDECLKTNVLGTQNVIKAIRDSETLCSAILISTDKAVLPINTYGTSKKMAEKLWINAESNTCYFSVCRYGNVVGSSGSVLPLFLKLVDKGVDRLPVTDERMTRFWFEMDDAVNFVLDTIDDRNEGVCVPKIPSVRIIDVCKALDKDYVLIGIREGEKLHEFMIPPDEVTDSKGYSSGNNEHFLTVDEIRRSIDAYVKRTNSN